MDPVQLHSTFIFTQTRNYPLILNNAVHSLNGKQLKQPPGIYKLTNFLGCSSQSCITLAESKPYVSLMIVLIQLRVFLSMKKPTSWYGHHACLFY